MRCFISSAVLLLLLTATFVGCNETTENTPLPVATDPIEATNVSFANSKCPIMGGEPTEELMVEYEGKTIGFCCDGCPEKWAGLSDEEKLEKFATVDAHANQ